MACGWIGHLRTILELLYFTAGIVIAVFAGLGLRQISLTKKIATTSAKREAIKFAAERCQYYADKCVPAHNAVVAEQDRLKLTFLKTPLIFSIENAAGKKQIRFQAFNQASYVAQYDKMRNEIVICCNELEAFAIPFAAGVADDELGFQETAATFCQLVEQLIGMIAVLRTTGAHYESTLTLYERWKSRVVAQNLEGQMKKMSEIHKQASEKGRVQPIDPL